MLIEKTDGCKNNPENSPTAKIENIFRQVFYFLQYRHLKA